jgi:hypothetical protein
MPKALPVRLDDCGGLHQDYRVQTPRLHSAEPYPEEAVYREQSRTVIALAAQNGQLVAQRDDLKVQRRPASAAASEPRKQLRA